MFISFQCNSDFTFTSSQNVYWLPQKRFSMTRIFVTKHANLIKIYNFHLQHFLVHWISWGMRVLFCGAAAAADHRFSFPQWFSSIGFCPVICPSKNVYVLSDVICSACIHFPYCWSTFWFEKVLCCWYTFLANAGRNKFFSSVVGLVLLQWTYICNKWI